MSTMKMHQHCGAFSYFHRRAATYVPLVLLIRGDAWWLRKREVKEYW